MPKIEVHNLTMRFKDTVALKQVNFTLEEHKIYGLLGRNGAGKSTLLNLMTNKLFPTEGYINVDGQCVMENDEVLSQIYCMSEQLLYPESMQVQEVFRWSAQFYPNFDMEYAVKLAQRFDLRPNKCIKELSTGYHSIFKLIIALSCGASVILLDEPVLGLDAHHRELFYKELLVRFSEHPATYILSTHLIEEVADLVEEVIVLRRGQVILQDQVEHILRRGYTVSGKASAVDAFIEGKQVIGTDSLGGLKTAYIAGERNAQQIPPELEVSRLNLQRLFIELTADKGGEQA